MNIYVAIACLLASANADGSLGLGGLGGLVYAPAHASLDYYAYPRYAFEYAVKDPHTGDNKAQWEKREGDVVKGAYSLVEPDGSLRVVEYWADDKSGFNAIVKRLGPSVHPTPVHATPIYKAPIPVLSQGSLVSPISIGPVAQLQHLASAPLISGPAYGAVSTQSLIKEPLPVVKTVIPAPIQEPLPIVPVPVIKPAALAEPIYRAGPLYTRPLGPPPSYKAPLPIYKAPLPVYKEAPLPINPSPIKWQFIDKEPIAPWGNLGKGPIGPWEGRGPVGALELGNQGLIKGPIGPWEGRGPVGPLGLAGQIIRGPIGPWEGRGPVGPLELGDQDLSKEPIGPWEGLGRVPIGLSGVNLDGYGVGKGPIGPLPLGAGYELTGKGPELPAWGGPLDYSLLGYKQ